MKSIGQILKSARERRRLTHEGVYSAIRIHPKFLSALENDDYAVFSGKVHSKGFLKVYAEFLDLNVDEMLALWRRDYERELEQKELLAPKKGKLPELPKTPLTPTVLLLTLVSLFVLAFFGYLFYQYRNFTGAPNLEVFYPRDNEVVKSDILDITGKTDLDSELFINDQKAVLKPDGSFAISVKIKDGLNTISVSAVNRLGKKTEVIRTAIYRPDFPPTAAESSQSSESPKDF